MSTEPNWPSFTRFADKQGVTSTYSFPLEVGDRIVGLLNLYSLGGRFDDEDETLARAVAREAAVAVANSQAMAKSRDLVGHLHSALETRDLIGRAIGLTMATRRCEEGAAFEHLRTRSQTENRPVREIAREVLDDFSGQLADDPEGG